MAAVFKIRYPGADASNGVDGEGEWVIPREGFAEVWGAASCGPEELPSVAWWFTTKVPEMESCSGNRSRKVDVVGGSIQPQ